MVDNIDVNMNCASIKISDCVIISDSRGNVASWGKIYNGQTKDNVEIQTLGPFQVAIRNVNKISCS